MKTRGLPNIEEGASVLNRTDLAGRRRSPASLLAVALQQQVGSDEPVAVGDDLPRDGFSHRSIRGSVALALLSVAEAQEHAEAVRIQGEERMSAGQEQDLLRSRRPDGRELPQLPHRLLRRKSERGPDVAIEVPGRDLGAPLECCYPKVGLYPEGGHRPKALFGSCQDVRGAETDTLLQQRERASPLVVIHEVSDVLPQNDLERVLGLRGSQTAVDLFESVDPPREWALHGFTGYRSSISSSLPRPAWGRPSTPRASGPTRETSDLPEASRAPS